MALQPADGSVGGGLNSTKCMGLEGGNLSNGSQIMLWDCNGGINQQWVYDGDLFRSRMDRNKITDAKSGRHGTKVTIWGSHGRANQRWTPVLQ